MAPFYMHISSEVAYNKDKLLDGCIVLNEHNTVYSPQICPLYATGVSLAPVES